MKIVNQRNYGIDLLRITSMIMILILHILGQGGILNQFNPLSLNYEMMWFLEIACFCAVNCYGLISGYVGIDKQYSYSNLILLWLQVFYYSVLITIIFAVLNPGTVGKANFVFSLLPVFTKRYWYFSSYFALALFIPFINKSLNKFTKNEACILISILFVFTSVIPTFLSFGNDPFSLKSGYSAIWLLELYIIGAFIKKFGLFDNIKSKTLMLIYFIIIIISLIFKSVMDIISINIIDSNLLIDYTSPTIFISALCLFIVFIRLKVDFKLCNLISFFSSSAFSVYLIHTNNLVFNCLENIFIFVYKYNTLNLTLFVLSVSLLVFVILVILDKIRIFIFEKIDAKRKCQRIVSEFQIVLKKQRFKLNNEEKT